MKGWNLLHWISRWFFNGDRSRCPNTLSPKDFLDHHFRTASNSLAIQLVFCVLARFANVTSDSIFFVLTMRSIVLCNLMK